MIRIARHPAPLPVRWACPASPVPPGATSVQFGGTEPCLYVLTFPTTAPTEMENLLARIVRVVVASARPSSFAWRAFVLT